MLNMKDLMKQAQNMQKKMEEAQEKLAQAEVIGVSGGGMVKITLNGKSMAQKAEIDKSLLNCDDLDILEDLIVAAINDAQNKVEKMANDGMKSATGGLDLGGMKLPF